MIRALIIDDELSGIKLLKILIERYPQSIRLVAATTDAAEGIKLVEDYKPDVVFLDISMPDMNGFELLNQLSFRSFKLVFTTAHEEYSLQAIKSRAFDYLLKPITDADFKNCISSLLRELYNKPAAKTNRAKMPGLIELPVKGGIIFIKQRDVIRVEASGSYTTFYLEGQKKYLASKNIKEYEMYFDPNGFFRCHQSHIINLKKVSRFLNHDGFFAEMNDGSLVDISKRQKDLFLEKLKNI